MDELTESLLVEQMKSLNLTQRNLTSPPEHVPPYEGEHALGEGDCLGQVRLGSTSYDSGSSYVLRVVNCQVCLFDKLWLGELGSASLDLATARNIITIPLFKSIL